MSDLTIYMYGPSGPVPVRVKDNGDGTYSLATTAVLTGDVQIGAVELKDAASDDRAKVAATASIAEGDIAVAVQAPVLGATSGAAVVTDAGGTLQQYLRGLVKWAFERMPASLGQKAKAAALAVTLASDEDLLARLGEVQVSPTANTVLDRLKALLTGIVLAAGSAIIGKVGIDQTTPGTTNGVQVLDAAALVVPTQITKTVAAAATPEALAADATFFRSATVIAKKAARTANTGVVYLGIGSGNDTQALELQPGDVYTLEASVGQKYDLNDWYLDVATAGDGVVVIYS